MTVSLSVKSVPEEVAERLRRRAARNHRSLQGELLSILTEAARAEGAISPSELLAWVRRSDLETPAESSDVIRADRDAR